MPRASHMARKILPALALLICGATYRIDMAGLANGFAGQAAHLYGFKIKGTIGMTVAASLNGTAKHGLGVLRLIKNFKVNVEGHDHFVNMDGEDLAILEAMRVGTTSMNAYGGITQNVTTGANSVPFELNVRWDQPNGAPGTRFDDAIPLAVFDRANSSYVEFNVGSDFGIPTAVASVTDSGAPFSALSIMPMVVMREDVVMPTPWQVSTQNIAELVASIRPAGGVEFLLHCNRLATTFGSITHSTPDGMVLGDFMIGDSVWQSNLTPEDYREIADFARTRAYNDNLFAAAGYLGVEEDTATGWSGIPLIVHASDTLRTKYVRGNLTYQVTARPSSHAATRLMMSVTGDRLETPSYSRNFVSALGGDPAQATFTPKSAGGGGDAASHYLPSRLNLPGLRWGRARTRVAKRRGQA